MEPLFMKPVFQEKFGAAVACILFLVLIYRVTRSVKIGRSVRILMG